MTINPGRTDELPGVLIGDGVEGVELVCGLELFRAGRPLRASTVTPLRSLCGAGGYGELLHLGLGGYYPGRANERVSCSFA